jgi:hypothetical protein
VCIYISRERERERELRGLSNTAVKRDRERGDDISGDSGGVHGGVHGAVGEGAGASLPFGAFPKAVSFSHSPQPFFRFPTSTSPGLGRFSFLICSFLISTFHVVGSFFFFFSFSSFKLRGFSIFCKNWWSFFVSFLI